MSLSPLSILAIPLALALQPAGPDMREPVQYKLDNGLTVTLDENHRSPLVTVSLLYGVGVMNSEPGKSGLPHMFEHLAFQGSRHIGKDAQDTAVFASGGDDDDASTHLDRTVFHSTAPSNQLEMLLWLHSDRMGFLDGALSDERFANQLDVVLNERRQRVEDDPYGRARFVTQQLLFTEGHPCHPGGFGAAEDIRALTLDDAHRFLERYYKPANATMVLSGDFDPKEARRLIDKYFGSLPATPRAPFTPPVQKRPARPLRRALTLDVKVPEVQLSWIVATPFSAGAADLDLAVSVLSAGKNGRLYRELVEKRKLAREVGCTLEPYLIGSVLTCAADAAPGQPLDAVAKGFDDVLAELRRHGPTDDELAGAKAMWRSDLYHRLETTKTRAELFNRYVYYTGSSDRLERELGDHERATRRSVRDAAHQWLDPAHRLVLTLTPGPAVPPAATPPVAVRPRVAAPTPDPQPWRKQRPPAASASVGALPKVSALRLSNGIPVYVVANRATPLVVVRAVADKGAPGAAALPGLSRVASDLLLEATSTRSADVLAREAASLGARLTSDDSYDTATVTLDVPTAGFTAGLALLADVVRNARATAETLESVRRRVASERHRQEGRGAVVAEDVLRRALFGADGRYGMPLDGTAATLERISLEDVRRFHEGLWSPRHVAFVVAGDLPPEAARDALERAFGSWRAGDGPAPSRTDAASVPPASAPPASAPPATRRRRIIVVPREGSQASLAIGRIGVPRASRDWVAVDVLNRVFGGGYASRINLNLRERHGYAYTARSRFTENRQPGAFLINTAVASDKTAAAIGELLRELEAIHAAPPGGEELRLAKDGVALGMAARNESNEQLATTLERIPAFGLPLDYLDRYVGEVRAVTAAELRAAAQSAFRSDDLVIVIVGPAEKIRAQLSASGLAPFEMGAPIDAPASPR